MDQKYINSLNPMINDHQLLWRVDNVDSFIEWFNAVFKGKKHIEELL